MAQHWFFRLCQKYFIVFSEGEETVERLITFRDNFSRRWFAPINSPSVPLNFVIFCISKYPEVFGNVTNVVCSTIEISHSDLYFSRTRAETNDFRIRSAVRTSSSRWYKNVIGMGSDDRGQVGTKMTNYEITGPKLEGRRCCYVNLPACNKFSRDKVCYWGSWALSGSPSSMYSDKAVDSDRNLYPARVFSISNLNEWTAIDKEELINGAALNPLRTDYITWNRFRKINSFQKQMNACSPFIAQACP